MLVTTKAKQHGAQWAEPPQAQRGTTPHGGCQSHPPVSYFVFVFARARLLSTSTPTVVDVVAVAIDGNGCQIASKLSSHTECRDFSFIIYGMIV